MNAADLRIGILTSGGDAPGMNAVIAAACERIERLGAEAFGVRGGFAGLAERHAGRIEVVEARSHAHEPGTWLETSRWPQLREAAGQRLCLDALEALGVDGLLVTGGDGSAAAARAMAATLPVAFVPATIDHDVEGTGATIGMDSAIGYALDVIDRLRVTGRSLRGRAFLVQTLGAPNGYLADAVAAAAGIDEVLVPERPYDLDAVAAQLGARASAGTAIAVMSEAVGNAVAMAARIADRTDLRVHPTILGHAQRAATPSALDRALAEAAAAAAVEALASGRSSFVALAPDGTVALTPLTDRQGATR